MVTTTTIPGKYKRVEVYGEQGGPYYIKDDENSAVTYTIVDEVLQIHVGKLPPPMFLVRPNDWQVFELDPSNGAYRTMDQATYHDGTKVAANPKFTLKHLLEWDFFPIEEDMIRKYMDMNKVHQDFVNWKCRPDGHGGTKGGTFIEYLTERFNASSATESDRIALIHALSYDANSEKDPELRVHKKAKLFGYAYGTTVPSIASLSRKWEK